VKSDNKPATDDSLAVNLLNVEDERRNNN